MTSDSKNKDAVNQKLKYMRYHKNHYRKQKI